MNGAITTLQDFVRSKNEAPEQHCEEYNPNQVLLNVLSTIRQLREANDYSDDENMRMLDDGFNLCFLSFPLLALSAWHSAFKGKVKPFFAMKCNPDEKIVREMMVGGGEGVGFDAASVKEIESCLGGSGEGGEKIIFANPQKNVNAIEYALHSGVNVMTFDSVHEADKIARVARGEVDRVRKVEVVARILVPDHGSKVRLGEKFGATPEEAVELYRHVKERHGDVIDFVGVSFHVGSGVSDMDRYREALEIAKGVVRKVGSKQVWWRA